MENSTFSHFAHIGFVVRDMEQVINNLAKPSVGPFIARTPPQDARDLVLNKPLALEEMMIVRTTQIRKIGFELMQPLERPSPFKDFIEHKGEGIHHLGFVAQDIDKQIESLTKNGTTILVSIGSREGVKFAYLDLNTGGIIIEIVQLPAR